MALRNRKSCMPEMTTTTIDDPTVKQKIQRRYPLRSIAFSLIPPFNSSLSFKVSAVLPLEKFDIFVAVLDSDSDLSVCKSFKCQWGAG